MITGKIVCDGCEKEIELGKEFLNLNGCYRRRTGEMSCKDIDNERPFWQFCNACRVKIINIGFKKLLWGGEER